MLRFRSLGSGSTGNATLVEARDLLPTRLLVDCGLGIRQLTQRLEQSGLALDDLDAIFITHEHSDHIGCAHALSQRLRIPVWMSGGTHAGSGAKDFDGLLRRARDGIPIVIGGMQITPFGVPHDAREPLQLSCTDGAAKLGILTDLGHATPSVLSALHRCDALLLESNHDVDLLAQSSYPDFLKRRVGGLHGHLSNSVAAGLARELTHPGLKHLVAAHLSAQNNRPALVKALMGQTLGCAPTDIVIAGPLDGTPWLAL
ncbi:MAG: MBL fold metallo-hydrolase [Polaromonas sp.]|nr:MBL fold metallo-hydrolase [Polaromonas sp.]